MFELVPLLGRRILQLHGCSIVESVVLLQKFLHATRPQVTKAQTAATFLPSRVDHDWRLTLMHTPRVLLLRKKQSKEY
jgi:hypothetical protein